MLHPKSHAQYEWPKWPHFAADEIDAVTKVLASGKVNYWTGEECHRFENDFAKYCGTAHAIAMMNGTVALQACLSAIGVGPGDEVITTPKTFIATASSIVLQGATPVFADIDETSQNITAKNIEKVITNKTKAVIPVHLAGWPCEMDEIMDLAKQHDLKVIEDCAQAHGACYKGKMVGSWGDLAAFSFCQDKIITTGGEGGMVITNNPEYFEYIWALKDHGKSYRTVKQKPKSIGFQWLHESFGTNWRMTEIQAVIGSLQLKKLPAWLEIRNRNANILKLALSDLASVEIPRPGPTIKHAYYKFYISLKKALLKASRDDILQALNNAGIPAFAGSCSEVYRELAFKRLSLPSLPSLVNAKKSSEVSLMFLVHPTLNIDDMQQMGRMISDVLISCTKSP